MAASSGRCGARHRSPRHGASHRPSDDAPAVTAFLSRLERLDRIDSTQRVVREWLESGEREVCVAVADHQRGGQRGRQGDARAQEAHGQDRREEPAEQRSHRPRLCQRASFPAGNGFDRYAEVFGQFSLTQLELFPVSPDLFARKQPQLIPQRLGDLLARKVID